VTVKDGNKKKKILPENLSWRTQEVADAVAKAMQARREVCCYTNFLCWDELSLCFPNRESMPVS
jgi:hypothetical protein